MRANHNYLFIWLSTIFFSALYLNSSAQVPILEIWEIQGEGLVSPKNNAIVRSEGNIVSAVGDRFFYMQCPADRSDNDSKTSDGLLVFTGFEPTVQPGDIVTVEGRIQEVFQQTQFSSSNLSFTITGGGASIPAPVQIGADFPGLTPESATDLEQLEGMLVQIEGVSCSPSNDDGLIRIKGGGQRAFREPGIAWPGLDDLPVWDGNPEIFWLDPDGLGAPDNRFIGGGTKISAMAVMSQFFDRYRALAIQYELIEETFTRPVREKRSDEITIASINALLLSSNSSDYNSRLKKLAKYLDESLRTPDVIAFQEIGTIRVLQDLSTQLTIIDPALSYAAYLLSSGGGIQTGFLIQESLGVVNLSQLGQNEQLSIGGSVHDRPPLLAEIKLSDPNQPLLRILNLHLRSLNGIEEDNGPFVRTKRHEQALSVSRMIQSLRDENLIVLGDFNAYPFTDGYVDVLAQLQGRPTLGALFPVNNIVNPPMKNLAIDLQEPLEQYSFVFNGNAQMLDHCLSNDLQHLYPVELAFARGNADQPEAFASNDRIVNRVSDHDGFVLFLSTTPVSATSISSSELQLRAPNPIGSGQKIVWEWARSQNYTLRLLDAAGRQIERISGEVQEGEYIWPTNLSPGFYFLSIQNEKGFYTKKLISR